ncbi:MAG: single-stranded DNA-binding protein [Akkermansia sp.]
MQNLAQAVIDAARELRDDVMPLQFGSPVAYVYNPLDYAWLPHVEYLEKYANDTKKVIFLGMNPGPFGMAQTGVPFGEIDAVTNWLHVFGMVSSPVKMHPKRPIDGFGCKKSEVSGRRLWGLFREVYGTAEEFFKSSFVANYCPLIWMSETGSNITPDKLSAASRAEVDEVCMRHLVRLIRLLEPELLVGVGAYATTKLKEAASLIPERQMTIGTLLHPSPASPIANKNWPDRPMAQLRELGLMP